MNINYKLLKEMIQIESTEDRLDKKLEILELIKKNFSKHLYVKNYKFINRPILVISNTKSKDLDLIISTHADVVSADNKLFTMKESAGKIFGRGTYDMKSALLASLTALHNSQKTKNKIGIFITTDEEIDGLSTNFLLEKAGYRAKFAILPDGGSLNNIVTYQKGFLQLKLTFNGKSAHASEPWKAINPAEIAINAFEKIKTKFPNPSNSKQFATTLSLTKIICGESLNQIPNTCELYLDIRFVEPDSIKEIVKTIKQICPNNIKIEIVASNEPFSSDIDNPQIIKLSKIIKSVTSKKVIFEKECSTSDAIYFSKSKIPAVLFRPNGGNMHQDDEFVDKKSLEEFYQVISGFINDDN